VASCYLICIPADSYKESILLQNPSIYRIYIVILRLLLLKALILLERCYITTDSHLASNFIDKILRAFGSGHLDGLFCHTIKYLLCSVGSHSGVFYIFQFAVKTYITTDSNLRGFIQKFPDLPPGARTANGTALCH